MSKPKVYPFFIGTASANISYNNFLLLPHEFHYLTTYEKLMLSWFEKIIPINYNIDFNFYTKVHYNRLFASVWDFFLIDYLYSIFSENYMAPLITSVDSRNNIFPNLAYTLVPLVDLKNCWWYIFIIKIVKFYNIFYMLNFWDVPFFPKLVQAYFDVEGYYYAGAFSVFFMLIFIFIIFFHGFFFLLNLPFFIYSFLKSFFLFFFNFFHIINYLLWGYYRLEENEEGDYIFFARPEPYENDINDGFMVMKCQNMLQS